MSISPAFGPLLNESQLFSPEADRVRGSEAIQQCSTFNRPIQEISNTLTGSCYRSYLEFQFCAAPLGHRQHHQPYFVSSWPALEDGAVELEINS